MKNKKIILAFTLTIVFLLVMVAGVKATNDVSQIPIIEPDNNNTMNMENSTPDANSQNPTDYNNQNVPDYNSTASTNNEVNNSVGNNETLPKTGVAEDTALFVFIIACIVSAVYAFVRIRNYKNI